MEAHENLLEEVEAEIADIYRRLGHAPLRAEVIEAMRTVPREVFLPDHERHLAYINAPLSIGHGQTISQPLIVGLMTDLLEPSPEKRILEVGAGSGYQAAILSKLVREVYSVEIIAPLAEFASTRLSGLGIANVQVRIGDGWFGWPEHAPFDGIIVTAAGPRVPPALIEQLGPGGKMVIPVGERWDPQDLLLVSKDATGAVSERRIIPVAFVPLTGGH